MPNKNNEFILIEPFRRKYEHLDFLQSILSVLIQKKCKLIFWTSKPYFSALQYKFRKQIHFQELKFDDTLVGIQRFFFSLCNTLAIILKNRKKNILVLSSLPVVSLIICLFSYLFNLKNIHLVINGELTCLASKRSSLSIKFDKLSCILFLRIGMNNGKILIISEKIYRDIRSDLKPHRSVTFIEPIGFFHKPLRERTIKKNTCINFLSLGVQNTYKNSFEFNKLALTLDRNLSQKRIMFNVLGKIDFEPGFVNSINVLNRNQNRMLDIKDFKDVASKNHYLIFFLDETKYRYVASGSFFDALKYNLPILAFKNSFFDFYCSKFGSIGYLCSDIDEMVNLINDPKKLLKEYKSKIKNLSVARKYISQRFLKSALFTSA